MLVQRGGVACILALLFIFFLACVTDMTTTPAFFSMTLSSVGGPVEESPRPATIHDVWPGVGGGACLE